MDGVFELMAGLPSPVVYTVLGVGAALENIVPPIPADTFVLLGGFLAARGLADPWIVWVVTSVCNVTSALVVYAAGWRYGPRFFAGRGGRWLLTDEQMQRIMRFYERFGAAAVFLTRFLPGLRAVVPAFAGVTHQPFFPVAVPLVAASALWYGALVWVGAFTGRNLDVLIATLGRVNAVLLGAALVVGVLIAWWWVKTRQETRDQE